MSGTYYDILLSMLSVLICAALFYAIVALARWGRGKYEEKADQKRSLINVNSSQILSRDEEHAIEKVKDIADRASVDLDYASTTANHARMPIAAGTADEASQKAKETSDLAGEALVADKELRTETSDSFRERVNRRLAKPPVVPVARHERKETKQPAETKIEKDDKLSILVEDVKSKTNGEKRPKWHETWMTCAETISHMSYDPRYKVGCIIVPDDNTQILSLGFNGNASGLPNVPESMEPGMSGFLHAELNACLKLDYNNTSKKIMYVTMSPCKMCAKAIIQSGIKKIIYRDEYRDTTGLDILRSVGIDVSSLGDELIKK